MFSPLEIVANLATAEGPRPLIAAGAGIVGALIVGALVYWLLRRV